jgi:hypothetical protein
VDRLIVTFKNGMEKLEKEIIYEKH